MWNEIKNEIDIENLMKKYSGFHDSCIVSINYHSGAFVDDNGGMANGELLDHSIEMILHSQWNKPIELRFTGVRKCNIVVFYGSNSWSYTRLGKMNMPEREVIELLSNGDVELKISKE